jgi:hypothetical protein
MSRGMDHPEAEPLRGREEDNDVMSRTWGWVAIVVGIILVLIALFGGQLGFGGTNLLGIRHVIAFVVGIVVLVVGAYLALLSNRVTSA